jgi:hypothetical protein
MSLGAQVVDMDFQEPYGQSIAPEGHSFSFDAFYTSPPKKNIHHTSWSQKEMGLDP